MRRLVLVMAACSVETPRLVDAPLADAPSADAPLDAPPAVVDRNCADVKARLATVADGVHWIDPDLDGVVYRPFAVYCGEMATPSPHEYLELARTSAPADPPVSNYTSYTTGHGCTCGTATTLYSKVRLDPVSLVASSSGFRVYADSTQLTCLQAIAECANMGWTVAFGSAGSCVMPNDASAHSNVDLRGTPFHVAGADTTMFRRHEEFDPTRGYASAGSAAIDETRKLVELTGGGDCGGFGALNGVPLALDQGP